MIGSKALNTIIQCYRLYNLEITIVLAIANLLINHKAKGARHTKKINSTIKYNVKLHHSFFFETKVQFSASKIGASSKLEASLTIFCL